MISPHKNQQDATNFSSINLFKSAQHVSGDKLGNTQEHSFDCIYSFWYNALTLLQQRRCIVPNDVYTFKRVLLMMGEFVARNMLGWIKKINKRKSCCILLVIYIVVLKWCTVTQTSRRRVVYCTRFTTDSSWNKPLFESVFNFGRSLILALSKTAIT